MKNFWWIVFTVTMALLSACWGATNQINPARQNRSGGDAVGFSGAVEQDSQLIGSRSSPAVQSIESQGESSSSVQQLSEATDSNGHLATPHSSSDFPSTAKASQEVPYATPVPGKKDLVTSPYAPRAGYVDIHGYPPGQEVRCPYTGKLFRVP